MILTRISIVRTVQLQIFTRVKHTLGDPRKGQNWKLSKKALSPLQDSWTENSREDIFPVNEGKIHLGIQNFIAYTSQGSRDQKRDCATSINVRG